MFPGIPFPKSAPAAQGRIRSMLTISLCQLMLCLAGGALAAPAVRIVAQPPNAASSVSRFNVIAELYETTTGNRIEISGVSVTLRLLRCPGHPSACTVAVVDNNFASANSSAGLVTFSALTIDSAANDYYFATSASGYNVGTSDVFDVSQAVLSFDNDIPDPLSTASRFPLTVSVLQGPGLPRDPMADSLPLRLAAYRCPGYPSSCSVVTIDTNFANATANNGVATFSGLNFDTANDDYYLFVTLAPTAQGGASGQTSNVVDVDSSRFVVTDLPTTQLSTASRLPLRVEIWRGVGAGSAIDAHADSVSVRLGLFECPGFPSSCSVNTLNSNFINGTAFNGIVQFSALRITDVGDDRYFYASSPALSSISGATSQVFDVDQAFARIMSPTPNRPALVPFSLDVAVLAGGGQAAPIDSLAGGITLRLDSHACPGFPSACTPILLQTGFGQAVTVAGVAEITGLTYPAPAEDRYLVIRAPTDTSVGATSSDVFDVLAAPPEIFADGFEQP
jgi:hypothetical protein